LPEPDIDFSNYFKPGDVFYSSMEGIKQTVIKQENGKVYCRIEIGPQAAGPPLHIHTSFDETFAVQNGELTIIAGDETKILKPGETYLVPKGVPHKPFNQTDSTIVAEMDSFAFPEKFAVYLTQVYGFIDESPANMQPPTVILQMALFNQHFDSYLAEAPPVAIQKFINFLVIPAARLLGYESFYDKYRVRNTI
jgi:mannose-6-phosphate isomerase-like protein (cupin superfamily)